jgi:hypothetical protein
MTPRIKATRPREGSIAMRFLAPIHRNVVASVVLFAAGCANAMPVSTGNEPVSAAPDSSNFTRPALITFDLQNDIFVYWQIARAGGTQYQPLSRPLDIYNARGMAAKGSVLIVTAYAPPKVVSYDVVKQEITASARDPYGEPYDIAVDKQGTIYALNDASVAVYKSGTSTPTELTCSYITNSEAIAVNNEGDLFVDGLGPNKFIGVVEYPARSTACKKLDLRAIEGYIGGIGVDPKTDDLIVVDNPGVCILYVHARMMIYPRPYQARTGVQRYLVGDHCAQRFRLDASSTHIFVADSNDLGFPYIDQNRYPSGTADGTYTNGQYASGNFAGFTTIPNRLPN